MSVGWTLWHGAKIAFLYSIGIPIESLIIFGFTVFFTGILLGAAFELGSGSIWPGALMHSAFNAATLTYYSDS